MSDAIVWKASYLSECENSAALRAYIKRLETENAALEERLTEIDEDWQYVIPREDLVAENAQLRRNVKELTDERDCYRDLLYTVQATLQGATLSVPTKLETTIITDALWMIDEGMKPYTESEDNESA